MHQPRIIDAIVVGGGPAGSASAIFLALAGWRVALLERRAFPRGKVCGEYLSATNWPLLEAAGVAHRVREAAGPPVNRVGLLAGARCLSAGLPLPQDPAAEWGRALSRAQLDCLLLDRARELGVEVRQPWSASDLSRPGETFLCRARSEESEDEVVLEAPIVIAAHGSWEPGPLLTQGSRSPPSARDLFGFKARFGGGRLPPGLMPLVSFPGGYGGLVESDAARISLSLCIRRDVLEGLPRGRGLSAGEAALEHLLSSCPALRPILAGADRDGPWLSAGPIRPGIRPRYHGGVFAVGNAAGEAHPVVAEGISMALQSAWLLARCLIPLRGEVGREAARRAAARRYSSSWRRSFGPRIRAAALVAHWAMRPRTVSAALPLLSRFPEILTMGARFSGKARPVEFEDGGGGLP
jgi:2-polyprenyl-6-methoxyphenol hydroxylase-like FAD-dependent oxidoreductase